jgi:excisionase family DNA binding protein
VEADEIGKAAMFSPKQIADYFDVSTVTITRAIRDGKLAAYRIGGQWRITAEDVAAFVKLSKKER